MTPQDQKRILSNLNSIAPDTFNEGQFGPWKFKSITQQDQTFTLTFTNAEGAGEIVFDYEGDPMDDGYMSDEFFEVINECILGEGF